MDGLQILGTNLANRVNSAMPHVRVDQTFVKEKACQTMMMHKTTQPMGQLISDSGRVVMVLELRMELLPLERTMEYKE
jgi:hypothetical protein